ncbi:hypothetical protein LZ198_07365 [Myxococcus sp. K15C18031901]|uniref:hypothetical protein n=1 Tax=Myxococcus dinghuensis TaxID=2906761 RepID=UPI0020A7B808|nr:hypothetical protein [Myxococcus dinghuensis]MCP3098694.1 hypothetical protein [Myxococcus dinghuensis]
MDMLALQEQFIEALLEAVPEPWERLEVHYEKFAWGGEDSEIYVANRFLGEQKADMDLTMEALDALEALRGHRPQGQAEPWTWLVFSIEATGQYHFDFRYGVPPFIAREMAAQ